MKHNDLEQAKFVINNFPESGMCISCDGWKFDDANDAYEYIWIVPDEECEDYYKIQPTEVTTGMMTKVMRYVITPKMIADVLPAFRKDWIEKDWYFDGANPQDATTWDAWVYDAVIQKILFGDVILG